jgi:hypothetical protein
MLLHAELYRPDFFLAFVAQRKMGIERMNLWRCQSFHHRDDFLNRPIVLDCLSGMGWKIEGKEQCNFTIDHGFRSQKGKIRSLEEEY